MKHQMSIHPALLFILASYPIGAISAEKADASPRPLVYQTHDGYFVSNQFETDAPVSFVVLKDQAAFDKVFGVAMVMRDKSHRLPPDAFAGQWVVAAIHRGKSLVRYQVERVAAEGKTLTVRYTTKSEPSIAAELACPLIVSVPKGKYDAIRFFEDGNEIKRLALPLEPDFTVTAREAGTLTTDVEGGKSILSIKGGSGIGKALVRRVGDAWPREIVVRAYLGGLEQFAVSDGRVKLSASVLSHSGNRQLLHLWRGEKESPPLDGKSPYWMEVQMRDVTGRPIDNLPPKGGWFEMTIPQALLNEGNSLEIEWIDFYR